jgi:lysylphosphatidylglycerol synthetase-like protein (DUF2156 family)
MTGWNRNNLAIYSTVRHASVSWAMVMGLHPKNWALLPRCLRRPSLMGVTLADVRALPKGFIIGNIVVTDIHASGVLAAVYAGATLPEGMARTALLLSSVVNGLATITLALVVDPVVAQMTDKTVQKDGSTRQVYAASICLVCGMVLGTLLSQAVFLPAAWLISNVADFLTSWPTL